MPPATFECSLNRLDHVATLRHASAYGENVIGFETQIVDHFDRAEILFRALSHEYAFGRIVSVELRIDQMVFDCDLLAVLRSDP